MAASAGSIAPHARFAQPQAETAHTDLARDFAAMRPYLLFSLFCLSLAASTGVLLRFGLIYGMPAWASNLLAVRHAHSHLMYFGWGTLAIMALIWAWLPSLTGRPLPRGVGVQMTLTAVLSLLIFPAFWANGYGTTEVFGRSLPLGAMTAAINGLPWFLFAWLYWRATRQLGRRPLPIALWDWAFILLLVASMGALGLGMQVALDVESQVLREASLHLFLDLFATGWFALASVGVLWAWLGAERWPAGWLPVQSIGICLGATFILGMSPAVVPESTFWIAAVANLAAAALLARHLWLLARQWRLFPWLVRFALLLFAVHLATALVVAIPGVWRWAAGTQLRVYFLHNLLLGWMSSAILGIVVAAIVAPRMGKIVTWVWISGVALMLAALFGLGFSSLVPVRPVVWLQIAAWTSILPATAATLTLIGGLAHPRAAFAKPSPSTA